MHRVPVTPRVQKPVRIRIPVIRSYVSFARCTRVNPRSDQELPAVTGQMIPSS